MIAAGSASATGAGDNYVGVLGTYLAADGQRDGSGGLGAAALVGLPLTPRIDLELSGHYSSIGRDSDDGSDSLTGLAADVRAVLLRGQVQPFLIGGLGGQYEHLSTAAKNDRTAPFVDAGVGLLVPVSARFDLRAEVRGYAVFDSDAYNDGSTSFDVRAGLGVQYRFGAAPPPAPVAATGPVPAAETPQVAVVDTAIKPADADADGDGVPDKLDQCPATPAGTVVDAKGCPLSLDSDNDGVPDAQDQCPGTPEGFKVDELGCLVAQVAVLSTVNFDFGSDHLTSGAETILDQLAASLVARPGLRVDIAGHTDALGPQALNLILSQKRAAAVKAYLVAHGVPASRLRAEGYGEFNPIASNDTEEGRARNRRVEFKLVDSAPVP